MLLKIFKFFVIVVFIYFLFLSMQPLRCYIWYPTIQAHPNNLKEIGIMVRNYFPNRTPENIQFFKLTDSSPLEAFRGKITDEQFRQLKKEIITPKIISKIMFYKKLYNRARPFQLAPDLVNAFNSTSTNTPAFPSGHAFQGYYAEKLLSQWEPERKKEWKEIANRIANIRIIAGLHFPSDLDFAKRLVDKL
jgi:hypothetical protein